MFQAAITLRPQGKRKSFASLLAHDWRPPPTLQGFSVGNQCPRLRAI
jgi:hypothetical protein